MNLWLKKWKVMIFWKPGDKKKKYMNKNSNISSVVRTSQAN